MRGVSILDFKESRRWLVPILSHWFQGFFSMPPGQTTFHKSSWETSLFSVPRLASLSCFGDSRVSLWKWSRLEKGNWTQIWPGNARDNKDAEVRQLQDWFRRDSLQVPRKEKTNSTSVGWIKKWPKSSFIGPIRVTTWGRECPTVIWVLTKIFAGLWKPVK